MTEIVNKASLKTVLLQHIDCPLCRCKKCHKVVEATDHQWGIEGRFTVVQCDQCKHGYMNPRPTLETLAACYPSDYGPHQLQPAAVLPLDDSTTKNHAAVSTPWYLRYLPLRYIPGLRRFFYWLTDERSQVTPSPFVVNSRPGSGASPQAFELGCAAGAYLARLQTLGWQVAGIEPGDGPVKMAQAAGLDVRQGTLDTVSIEPESFDFAASWMVIEHVPDPRTTLTQLFTLLKPGGQLAISVPNAGCWEPRIFGANWDAWDLPRHLHHFSPGSIRRLLKECGFQEIQVTHQRTLLNIFGSVGIVLTRRNPANRLGIWFLRYPHSPRLLVQLLAAPLAQLLAFFRQGGRLTITASKPQDAKSPSANQASVEPETST